MAEQDAVRKLILSHFEERRSRNPAYSMRAFAKFLRVSSSTLSELMNGKRRISRDTAEKIVLLLGLNPQESQDILSLFQGRRMSRKAIAPARLKIDLLKMDDYLLIADWYYFAILSLAGTENFVGETSWIANRLGLTGTEVDTAVKRLLKLEWVVLDRNGFLKPASHSFATPDGIENQGVRKNHHQTLDLAKRSLDIDPVENRNFTAMTMAIDPARLPEAARRMQIFRDELCAFLEAGPKKEVFKLSLQLFPLSKM